MHVHGYTRIGLPEDPAVSFLTFARIREGPKWAMASPRALGDPKNAMPNSEFSNAAAACAAGPEDAYGSTDPPLVTDTIG